MRLMIVILIIAASLYGGWFFIPGAYWTFQDGTAGLLYVQGDYEKFGWEVDSRYAFSGDYWISGAMDWKLIGERTGIEFSYSADSLEKDYRKPNVIEDDTINGYAPYELKEYSIYLHQNFNVGPSQKFYLYAGYNSGEYTSRYRYDSSTGEQTPGDEERVASAVDAGFEFSMDSRDDPENPETAFYFGIRLGGLYFQNAGEPDFDYLRSAQLSDPENEFGSGTGYIKLDQRIYGKLQTKQVPFPLILTLRISGGHYLAEVPQLMAFKAGADDFLRGIDQRHIMGRSYYYMGGELRAQVWERSYTPLILLHWLIPGYENPQPILEIAPIVEAGKVYSEYLGEEEKQYMTFGLGVRWIFTDYTVVRYDFAYWPDGKIWGAYFSFKPSI